MAKIFPAFAAAMLLAASTSAQAAILVRVSGNGADVAGCGGVAAPCRTLQFAHDQVDAGGYIVALDAADYGQIIARKGINLADETGGLARATPPVEREAAIVVLASATDVVRMRGFTLQSQLPNACGVHAFTAKRLEVDGMDIRNMLGAGINVNARSLMSVALRNTSISDGYDGVNVLLGDAPLGSSVYAAGLRVTNISHMAGIFGGAYSIPVLKDNLISGNGAAFAGVTAWADAALVKKTAISGFQNGLREIETLVTLSRSTLSGNNVALNGAGHFDSTGDNIIRGNADNSLGLIKPFTLH